MPAPSPPPPCPPAAVAAGCRARRTSGSATWRRSTGRRPASARPGDGADRRERRGQDDARTGRLRPARARPRPRPAGAGRAGYVGQDPAHYLAHNTVTDEVAYALETSASRRAERTAASATLARLGLARSRDRHPRDLSSGERQRLAIASVVVMQPDLLVLDEPTRGVDGRRKLRWSSWCGRWRRRARRSSSSPTTWTSPPRPRTSSRAWPPAGCWPTARPVTRSRRGSSSSPSSGSRSARVAGRRRRAAHRAAAGGPCLATPSPRPARGDHARPRRHRDRPEPRPRARARRRPRRRSRRRPSALRRHPERPAPDDDRRRHGVTLGPGGARDRRRGGAGVQRLPRPGAVDTLADDRLGHRRRDRGDGRADAAQPPALASSASPGGSCSTG